jgi:transposase
LAAIVGPWEIRRGYGEAFRHWGTGACGRRGCWPREIHQSEVARRVGVHRQSVSRWAQQLEAEGWHGLKKAGRAGRRPRLSAEDLKKIQRGLKRKPEALGYETGLWTAWGVAHLIEEECGVRYHTSQAWRILRQLGWSCPRPVGRAQER